MTSKVFIKYSRYLVDTLSAFLEVVSIPFRYTAISMTMRLVGV